jgi:hypothetical protein
VKSIRLRVNNHQAKEILLRYRPGTPDEREPEVAAALELAKQDPDLSGWLEDHCAIQNALRDKFRQVPVPEGLKEQILSERKTHFSFPIRRAIEVLAAAVALFLLCLVIVHSYSQRQDHRFAKFSGRMARLVLYQYPQMDKETNDPKVIRDFLASKGQGGYALPERLASTVPTGCKLVTWHEQPVSMICFASKNAKKPAEPDLFLFIIDRSALTDAPVNPPQSPMSGRISRLTTASWTSDNKTYLLAGLGDDNFLREHL